MHASFDRSGETRNHVPQGGSVGLLAFPILLVIALLGLAIAQPATSNWISELVHTELGNSAPKIAPQQPEKPTTPVHAVRTH